MDLPSGIAPFQQPIWAVGKLSKENNPDTICGTCSRTITSLSTLAVRSLLESLKFASSFASSKERLQFQMVPKHLFYDFARESFQLKYWNALKNLIAIWPFKKFRLSDVITFNCGKCWSKFLDEENDLEFKEGDSERQLFRKLFKNVLDGFFLTVRSSLEDSNEPDSPLRVLDLTVNPQSTVRSILWEEEFRRLCKRVMKVLDVCILKGLHRKMLKKSRNVTENENFCLNESSGFEISVWNSRVRETVNEESENVTVPHFLVVVDSQISEKSLDVLTWTRQRYDEFPDEDSPLSIEVRYLEVSMFEEKKFDFLLSKIPVNVIGLKLSELCEKKSFASLADLIPQFSQLRFLDLRGCAFDVNESEDVLELFSVSLSEIPHLERLGLAHNNIAGNLKNVLSSVQHGLECLDLSSCSLVEEDLIFLSNSVHARTLKALSLMENSLGFCWDVTYQLLCNLSPEIEILDIASNYFTDQQLLSLARLTKSSFLRLSFFDISWHEVTREVLNEILQILAAKESLNVMCLSTPSDLNLEENGGTWEEFIESADKSVNVHHSRFSKIKLHWCLM